MTVRTVLLDMLGALTLFVLFFGGLWIAYGAGLPTGGAELTGGVQ